MGCHYVYSCRVTSTRTRALDAGIDLVGSEGLRALTHARVDARAGLPKGSTSNYFRTRSALLSGVVDRILERELPGVDAAFAPASAADFVDALCALFEYTTSVNRSLTTARLVLFMEATHNADLREALSRGRAAMRASVEPVLAQFGSPDPRAAAEAIMACFEGLILHRVTRGEDIDPFPTFDLLVKAALARPFPSIP
jgi:DNA-binding transcriptional regulator YbjK